MFALLNAPSIQHYCDVFVNLWSHGFSSCVVTSIYGGGKIVDVHGFGCSWFLFPLKQCNQLNISNSSKIYWISIQSLPWYQIFKLFIELIHCQLQHQLKWTKYYLKIHTNVVRNEIHMTIEIIQLHERHDIVALHWKFSPLLCN